MKKIAFFVLICIVAQIVKAENVYNEEEIDCGCNKKEFEIRELAFKDWLKKNKIMVLHSYFAGITRNYEVLNYCTIEPESISPCVGECVYSINIDILIHDDDEDIGASLADIHRFKISFPCNSDNSK